MPKECPAKINSLYYVGIIDLNMMAEKNGFIGKT